MTIRTAKVLKVEFHEDEFSMGPDLDILTLEGLNCTEQEFVEWAAYAGVKREDLGCPYGNTKLCYIDASTPFKAGDVITISFNEFFEGRLNNLVAIAKLELINPRRAALTA